MFIFKVGLLHEHSQTLVFMSVLGVVVISVLRAACS